MEKLRFIIVTSILMKKLINHPEDVVEEMLQGFSVLHPGSARLAGHKVMLRDDAVQVGEQQVAIISGGGNGHEPAHAGYIGEGMLSAAVAGEIFMSPSSDSVFAANSGEEKRVGVMVNNLGATTEMELAIVARHAVPFLESEGYTVERIYAGTFLSSSDMAGISISVLGVNDEWLRWLDAPTSAPAWPNLPNRRPGKAEARIAMETSAKVSRSVGEGGRTDADRRLERAIEPHARHSSRQRRT
jgi:dihydroxyacetone kinase